MKNLVLNLAAPWVATVRSFINGDSFQESNIDLQMGDIADRLGYLKTALDAKARLTGGNTFTGTQFFSNLVNIGGDGLNVSGDVAVGGSLGFGVGPGLLERAVTGSATSVTLSMGGALDDVRIPSIGSNIIYTINSAVNADGHKMTLTRPVATDNFTVTFRDSGANTLGIIPANDRGWITLRQIGGNVRVRNWGGGTFNISQAV